MHTLSFTGHSPAAIPGPRRRARAAMLALDCLWRNAPFRLAYFPGDSPRQGTRPSEAMNGADQWWYLARTVLVDRRAYPLFSILFGFGMAIMASRTMERERRAALDTFSAEEVAGRHPVQRQIVEENIERHVRRVAARLIRRRGLWMLVFGAVHALFFSGDIIGTYGLVAVFFAEVVVMKRAWPRVLVGSLVAALSLLGLWGAGFSMGGTPMVLEYHGPMALTMFYPLTSLCELVGSNHWNGSDVPRGSVRHDRCGPRSLGCPAGSPRTSARPCLCRRRWSGRWRPRWASFCAHAADVGVCGLGRLVPYPLFHARGGAGCVRLACALRARWWWAS